MSICVCRLNLCILYLCVSEFVYCLFVCVDYTESRSFARREILGLAKLFFSRVICVLYILKSRLVTPLTALEDTKSVLLRDMVCK